MATYALKSAQVANARHIIGGTGKGEWNGYDPHIICGGIGTRAYRGFIKFNVNWQLISAATLHSATLRLWRDKAHSTGTQSSTLTVRGMAKDWAQTAQGGEFVWSGTTPYNWDNRAAYENHRPQDTRSKALGTPAGNQYVMDSMDITDIVLRWAPPRISDDNGNTGSNWANYGIVLLNDDQGTDSRCLEFVSNDGVGAYWPELVLDYDLAVPPNAPVNLSPTGAQEVPGVPQLKGQLSDSSPNEELSAVHLQVFFDAAGNNLKWGSGILPASGTHFSKKVGNPNWSAGRHYWWRGRTADTYGLWGPWSAMQEFISGTPPPAPTNLQPANGATAWTSPTFTGVSKDVDGDAITNAQIEVYSDAGVTMHWDSGVVSSNGSGSNFSVGYAGTGLVNGTTYYWRARVRNVHGRLSPWSQFQTFYVPDSSAVCYNLWTGKATTLTPTLSATAPSTQNAYEIVVYNKYGSVHWGSGTVAASGAAIAHVYNGNALTEGNKYEWVVRSRNTGNVWSDWSGRAPFWTNYKPVAVPVFPANNAVLPIPMVRTNFGDTDVANGLGDQVSVLFLQTYESDGTTLKHEIQRDDTGMSDVAHNTMLKHIIDDFEGDVLWRIEPNVGTPTVDTTDFSAGAGSLKISNPGVATVRTPLFTVYPAGDRYAKRYAWDFTGSDLGIFIIRVSKKASTLTNLDACTFRFYDGADNWAEYHLNVSTDWTERTVSPSSSGTYAVSGTLDWTNVIKVEFLYQSINGFSGDLLFDNFRYSNTVGEIQPNERIAWRARYTDDSGASNAQGDFSPLRYLTYSYLPVIKDLQVQAADLTTGDIHNPSPTLTWTFSGSGGKAQKSRAVTVYQSPGDQQETIVYSTGLLNGSAQSIQIPSGILSHTYTYKFEVTVEDTDGLTSQDAVTYLCQWTPPADLTPIESVGDEFTGATYLKWPMSQLSEAAFDRYEVKRYSEDDQQWTVLAVIYDQTLTEYWDYEVPFGHHYIYKVTQFENVSGSVPVESLGEDMAYVMLDIDDWMSVTPDREDLTMTFYMRREKHGDDAEQEVFKPWGRNSKVVSRSGVTGGDGSIEVIVPFDEMDDFKYKMKELNAGTSTTYLKSPFGDVWRVVFEPPQYSYKAGGHADASIKFIEVN